MIYAATSAALLTMLPALGNHDAAPPPCHRKVVHNQEPPLPGKGNEGS